MSTVNSGGKGVRTSLRGLGLALQPQTQPSQVGKPWQSAILGTPALAVRMLQSTCSKVTSPKRECRPSHLGSSISAQIWHAFGIKFVTPSACIHTPSTSAPAIESHYPQISGTSYLSLKGCLGPKAIVAHSYKSGTNADLTYRRVGGTNMIYITFAPASTVELTTFGTWFPSTARLIRNSTPSGEVSTDYGFLNFAETQREVVQTTNWIGSISSRMPVSSRR